MVSIVLIMLVILFIQAPAMVRQKQWWDLTVFVFFWGGGLTYALLIIADVNIPSPSVIIVSIVNAIYSVLLPG